MMSALAQIRSGALCGVLFVAVFVAVTWFLPETAPVMQ